jgi:hypothetical protein
VIFKRSIWIVIKDGFLDIGLLGGLAYERPMPILNNKVGGFCMSYCLNPSQIRFIFSKSYAFLLNKTKNEGVIQYSGLNN